MDGQKQNILEWAMANVFNTQHGANNAHLNKNLGASIDAIPFGSTVTTTNNVTASGGRLAQAGLVGIGLAAAGLGLWKLAGPELSGSPAPAVESTAQPSSEPVIIEGTLEWSVDEDGRARIYGIRSELRDAAGAVADH